jgi:hypothetical protein
MQTERTITLTNLYRGAYPDRQGCKQIECLSVIIFGALVKRFPSPKGAQRAGTTQEEHYLFGCIYGVHATSTHTCVFFRDDNTRRTHIVA